MSERCGCCTKGQCQGCRELDLYNAGMRAGFEKATEAMKPHIAKLQKQVDEISADVRDVLGYERIRAKKLTP